MRFSYRNFNLANHEASALRMFLRFLGSNGLFRPELVHSVPTVGGRQSESLPRHVGQDYIKCMIATYDAMTPMGVHDRTVLLLLAGLALWAGDASGPQLDDLN